MIRILTCAMFVAVAFTTIYCSKSASGDSASGSSAGTSGSPAGTNGSTQTQPTNLAYADVSATYTANSVIFPNDPTFTGSVTSWSISPALPAGLTLNAGTGQISGTPTMSQLSMAYTITASNSAGSTTANINITVLNELVFIQAIGSAGTANGQFQFGGSCDGGAGLFVNATFLYVSECNNSRVQRFNLSGVFQNWLGFVSSTWGFYTSGSSTASGFVSPIFVDATSNLYVASSNTIRKFTNAGTLSATLTVDINSFRRFTLDPSGNIFTTGTNNNSVNKYNAAGTLLTTFGSAGTGDGQFSNSGWTVDIVADSSGNIYMQDGGNARIQKFSNAGTFLTKWPASISGYSLMAIDEADMIYVLESSIFPARLRQYNTSGVLQKQYNMGAIPSNIAQGGSSYIFVKANKLYVSNGSNSFAHTVRIYSLNGTLPASVPGTATNLTVNPGVQRMVLEWAALPTAANYKVLRALAFGGPYTDITSNVTFSYPNRAVDTAVTGGTTYFYQVKGSNGTGDGVASSPISATASALTQSTLSFQQSIGSAGTANGQFQFGGSCDGGGGLFVTATMIHVSECTNSRVQRFSLAGAFQDWLGFVSSTWGFYTTGTSTASGFVSPISVDSGGSLYVGSLNTIRKFNNAGALTATLTVDLSNFRRLAVDTSGNLFITSNNYNSVNKYNASGTLLTSIGGFGSADGLMINSSITADIVTDSSNNVYILDSGNHRLQKFSNTGTFLAKWPVGISGYSIMTIDESDMIYVIEDFGTLRKYNTSGVVQAEYPASGVAQGGSSYIFARSGKLYVTNGLNSFANTVRVYGL